MAATRNSSKTRKVTPRKFQTHFLSAARDIPSPAQNSGAASIEDGPQVSARPLCEANAVLEALRHGKISGRVVLTP
jgi:D-arabinose 1-dehydrogenase-like Zn-dependent alcohol dehydrogenase